MHHGRQDIIKIIFPAGGLHHATFSHKHSSLWFSLYFCLTHTHTHRHTLSLSYSHIFSHLKVSISFVSVHWRHTEFWPHFCQTLCVTVYSCPSNPQLTPGLLFPYLTSSVVLLDLSLLLYPLKVTLRPGLSKHENRYHLGGCDSVLKQFRRSKLVIWYYLANRKDRRDLVDTGYIVFTAVLT